MQNRKGVAMIITRTPLRISFFGGGTDLPAWFLEHGGSVLSTTINKYLFISCREMPPFWDFKNRFVYGSRTETTNTHDEIIHPSIRETLKFLGIKRGIDMHYNTDVPARSGIGSSSAFTVGLLRALYGLRGQMVGDRRLAQEAIHIEQDLIGEAVGCQDQIAAAFGGFNHITFKKDGGFEVVPMTLPPGRVQALNDHMVLIFTGFQRIAAEIEEKKIKCVATHKQDFNSIAGYVDDAMEILANGKPLEEFGALLNDTWMCKRRLTENVSNPQLDAIYEKGRQNGAIGGKLLGSGGGGFMLFFVKPEDRERLIKAMAPLDHVPFRFDTTGSQTIYYQEEI